MFLLLQCFLVALQTWVTPHFSASSSLSLESDFFFLTLNKHLSSSHRKPSYSNLAWPMYIALNIGLEFISSVKVEEVYSHSICVHCCCLLTCELLCVSPAMWLYPPWCPAISLAVGNKPFLSLLISVKWNPGRCWGTDYSTPKSFAFLKLMGLKDSGLLLL